MTRLCFVSCLLASSACLDSLRVDRSAGDRLATCGNGVLDEGEACDDGNDADGDACTGACVVAVCGDGLINLSQDSETGLPVEACDDGNDLAEDACNNCVVARCGDGVLRSDLSEDDEAYEVCDDGNQVDNDQCSNSCRSLRMAEIAAGGMHSCARNDDGKVWCWGYNGGLQLGHDSNYNNVESPQVAVVNLPTVSEVAAGSEHSCARTTIDGEVWCWGSNSAGQLGDAASQPSGVSSLPVAIGGLPAVSEITAGGHHSCARTEDGEVWCWGLNDERQLGHHNGHEVGVVDLPAVSEITAGAYHSCARTEDGQVWCWGDHEYGQLGDGSNTNSSQPVAVVNLPAVSEITAGDYHSCARNEGGQVWCWGWNSDGQLGDGTEIVDGHNSSHSRPVAVVNLPAVSEITAGGHHSCARTEDGVVWCWGSNGEGQLGDGAEIVDGAGEDNDSSHPVSVVNLPAVSEITAGSAHSCARTEAGQIWCWGWDGAGQLGNGSNRGSSRPVRVLDPD